VTRSTHKVLTKGELLDRYPNFLTLVAQHDVVWKIDSPLSAYGERVCMYFHPATQSKCSNYTDVSGLWQPGCLQRKSMNFQRCRQFRHCFGQEHRFYWDGKTSNGVGKLEHRPLKIGFEIGAMYNATGKTMVDPSRRGMSEPDRKRYSDGMKKIDRKFKNAAPKIEKEMKAELDAVLAKFGSDGKIKDLDKQHCCDFDADTQCAKQKDLVRKGKEVLRLPCSGANMNCHRHRDLGEHGLKSKCSCSNGFLYDYRTRACTHTDTSEKEKSIKAWFKQKQKELEANRDFEQFMLRQKVIFGFPDPAFGGHKGGWRCSDAGDETWRLNAGGAITRKFRSDQAARR